MTFKVNWGQMVETVGFRLSFLGFGHFGGFWRKERLSLNSVTWWNTKGEFEEGALMDGRQVRRSR